MAMTFDYDRGPGPMVRVIADWTSDGDGDASGTTANKLVGRLVRAVTDPAAGGSAPTDDYDVTLADQLGYNVLAGCVDDLADRDTANTEYVNLFLLDAAGTPLPQSSHPPICSELTVTVANAGDTKSGRLVLFLEGVLVGSA